MNKIKKKIYFGISTYADKACRRIEKIQAWAYHRSWVLDNE